MKKNNGKGKPTLQWQGLTTINIGNDRWVANADDRRQCVTLERQINAKTPALGRNNVTWHFSYDDLESTGMECTKRVLD
jgi:hypothetical protein